jgi:plastocyanin
MRAFCGLVAALALLSVGGAAVAQTVAVTITKNGYVPKSVTIHPGDTVAFTNGDTVAHQVTFKSTTGVTCTPNPLVLQPTANGNCVFATAGSYSYSDPNTKGNTFRGTITVAVPPDALTMAAKPTLLVFGGKVSGTGTVSTQKAGESVDVLAQPCGASSSQKATTVQTLTGGTYAFSVQPLMNTIYTTKLRAASSPATAVRVRPQLRLARVALHRYSLRVSAGGTFAGKYAALQRYNGTLRKWTNVKAFPLKANSTGVAPAVISTASFRATIKARVRIRVVMSQAQVGSCYASGTSNAILR